MILDDDGNEMISLSMSAAIGDNVPFTLLVECLTGYRLYATSPDAAVVIWGKANPGDAFQNLETTPLDLTPYANTVRDFHFECRVDPGGLVDPDNDPLIYRISVSL